MTWMPGGHDNWFSVNLESAQFQLKFNRRATVLHTDFDKAADDAVQLLQQQWGNKDLYLALSGGIDSELAARTLLKNNIKFTPIILKIDQINAIETWFAEYWCQQNNVIPVILHYTIDDLIQSTKQFFPKLHAIKNYNQTPILIMYDYAEKHNGHCLYCGGDINLDSDKKQFFCKSLDFVSNIVDIGKHPTSFFMYTPELALSYINKFDINYNEQYNKLRFYNVSPRPKIDYVWAMTEQTKFIEVREKLFHIFKVRESKFDSCYWYGTKEQIIQALSP